MRSAPDTSRIRRWLSVAYRHSLPRFLFFSGIGLSFDLTLFWLLDFVLARQLAFTIAFAATYVLNFFMNRIFAFEARGGHVSGQVIRFLPQVSLDYALALGAVELLVFLGLSPTLARLIAASTNALVNYSMYRWWTFADRRGPIQVPVDVAPTAEKVGA